MAHYSTSSSSSESEEYESEDEIRQPATPASRSRRQQWPPQVPSSPPTSASSPRSTPRTRRQGIVYTNFFMPLSPEFDEAQRARQSLHESIRPAGDGHGFHYVPNRRRVALSPAGDNGETSSEEEEEDDETPEPMTQAQAEYRRAQIAHRARQAPRRVQEDSDSETASDGDTEDEDGDTESEDEDEDEDASVRRKPIIHEPQTPRSRSRTAAYTPPRDNFTLSEIRAHSRGREECDEDCSSDEEDGLSIIHPSKYSDAASSPPRESLIGMAAARDANAYPSPPPTDCREGNELADDFERLDCDADRAEHERWLKRQKAIRRAKRMSSGSIKRSFTVSQGSDTDDEDVRTEAGYESNAGSFVGSASGLRRMRRRTLEGNQNRASLLFDDPPQRIPEQEEPETDVERHDTWSPPRRIPDVAMDELPYWSVRGETEMEY